MKIHNVFNDYYIKTLYILVLLYLLPILYHFELIN